MLQPARGVHEMFAPMDAGTCSFAGMHSEEMSTVGRGLEKFVEVAGM